MPPEAEIQAIELQALLDAVYQRYGYDLQDWTPARVRSAVDQMIRGGGFASVSAFQEQILRDDAWLRELLGILWRRPARGMFADPEFWLGLRKNILPILRTWPTIRVWVAGCGGGEDAWSILVMLAEEGLLSRAMVYGTEMDETMLETARSNATELPLLGPWGFNYSMAGGTGELSAFFESDPSAPDGSDESQVAHLRSDLQDRVVYARHVPGIDAAFNEFHLVLFRNPFLWTNPNARDRIATLLRDSQVTFGFLCLDHADTLRWLPQSTWAMVDRDLAIARRIA